MVASAQILFHQVTLIFFSTLMKPNAHP
jgi:hypothetical protein